MPRSKPATPIQTPRRRSALQRVLRWGAMLIDILAVCALALTGYAGNVSPLKYGGYWGILPLCFPGVLLICTLPLIGQLFWHRRGAVVIFLGMIACSGPILTYSPLHICTPKIPAGAESFTFLTYNVHNKATEGDQQADHPYEYQNDICSCHWRHLPSYVFRQAGHWLGRLPPLSWVP